VVIAALVVLSGCGGEEPVSDQFTADLVQTAGGITTTGKLFAKAGNYRMDLKEGGQPLSVIVNQLTGTTTITAPLEKMYTKIPVDHPASVMNDPFQGVRYSVGLGEVRHEGTEVIEGYECDKSAIFDGDRRAITRWVSNKLDFPIKIVMHGKTEKVVELKNIQEVEVADSRFELPADFALYELPGQRPVAAPDWANLIATSPLMEPPFEKDLAAGDLVRIEPEAGKSLAVKAECLGDENCAAYAVPFRNGLPLREISTYANFAEPGTVCARRHQTSAEADVFVIRIEDGPVKLVAKWLPMHERRVKAGEEFRVPLVPGQNIEDVRFINMIDGESTCSWDFYSEGELLKEDIVGPAGYRTRLLRTKNESQRSVWQPHGDEIVIRVDSGEILIKLGQYDPGEF
jgi:hypothetical protein